MFADGDEMRRAERDSLAEQVFGYRDYDEYLAAWEQNIHWDAARRAGERIGMTIVSIPVTDRDHEMARVREHALQELIRTFYIPAKEWTGKS